MASFFAGKLAIVTGSSNGIGRATARMLAERGARITITGRNPSTLKETRDQCLAVGAAESDICEILGDLEDPATPKRIVDAHIAAFGGIDVLVNNAGMAIADPNGKMNYEQSISKYDRTMAVNLRSVILLSQLAVPHLSATRGSIVNVSSINSLPFHVTGELFYPLSKAALDSLTVQLAGDLIGRGIRVNSVNPGAVETDIVAKLGVPKEMIKDLFARIGSDRNGLPLGRVGQPEDIAKIILFLADRTQSEYIVGQRIIADGGTVIRNSLLSTDVAVFEK